jgi:hypothetical protein
VSGSAAAFAAGRLPLLGQIAVRAQALERPADGRCEVLDDVVLQVVHPQVAGAAGDSASTHSGSMSPNQPG